MRQLSISHQGGKRGALKIRYFLLKIEKTNRESFYHFPLENYSDKSGVTGKDGSGT